MNLTEIRQRVISEADLGTETSTEFKTRLDAFINRALNQMCLDAPNRFFEHNFRIAILPDVVPTLSTDLISLAGGDPYVFETNLTTGTTDAAVWSYDGTWDGRQIEIQGADDIWRKNKIRTIWVTGQPGVDEKVRFSLWIPWINTTEANASWRIADEHQYLPDDLVNARALMLDETGNTYPLQVIGQREAEELALVETIRNSTSGTPRYAFRRAHWQIPGPTLAPLFTAQAPDELVPGTVWIGPERIGVFKYRYTYVWGYQDSEFHQKGAIAHGSFSQFLEPRWESSPSPEVTAYLTYDSQAALYGSATLTFADIAYEQNFGASVAAPERYRHAGFRIRIYRQRATDLASPGHVDSPARESVPEPFYLIGELTEASASWPSWTDDGSAIPDMHRRLRNVNGYTAMQLHPRPNQRYIMDVRGVRRPQVLEDPSDAPEIDEIATDALIYKVLAHLKRQEREYDVARDYESMYSKELLTIANSFGDMRHAAVPVARRLARVGLPTPYKKWYNLPK